MNPFQIQAYLDTTEVLIYGDIGDSWSDEAVWAKDLVDQLAEIKSNKINVRINSYGGSVSDGLAIYNALKRHPAQIEVNIDGVAVSIASLIAMAGNVIRMSENALMMIHAPWTTATGNAKELRESADMLERFASAMTTPYANRIGDTEANSLLTNGQDNWFTAGEALNAGLIDEITEELQMAASLPDDRFAVPSRIKNYIEENTMPDVNTDSTKDKQTSTEVAAYVKQERKRKNDIRSAFKPFTNREGVQAVLDECIDDDSVSVENARLKLLEHIGQVSGNAGPLNGNYSPDPAMNSSDDRISWGENKHHSDFIEAATDALLYRSGIKVDQPHPAARDLHGRSLLDIAEISVGQQGKTFMSGVKTLMGGGTNEIIKAAMTSSDFPLLLANTANKSLMLGYENEPASHRMWTRPVQVRDFKPVSRVAMSEAPNLEEIPEAAEYKYGSLSERAESYALATYGKMLKISRQAIVNDDLTALTRGPQAFGGSAARLEADKVYNLLTSNPAMSDSTTLFHADHGNLVTGAALSVASLGAAKASMRLQKGIGGKAFLNVVPRFLIIPAALEVTAEQLIATLVDPSKSNNTANPEWIRSLELVVEPRLDADSTTAWYLAASVNQVDTVEIAHLDGQRGVFVEDEQEFHTDAYRIKARLDFATQVIDWVGLLKNPGA